MSKKEVQPRIGVTTNYGKKGEKPGDEGARKIDEFAAGDNRYRVTDFSNEPMSVRKEVIEQYEALYLTYRIDYGEYCVSVEYAGGKPKSETKLKRAPIGTQPAHVRAEYIQATETRFLNGTYNYAEYSEKVIAAGGTPKSEEDFDRQ